jgi:hypothetical protein
MDIKHLAVLSFEGINLLLPQQEVATIEVVNAIEEEGDVPGALGTLKSGDREWPVFALTSEFEQRRERPPNYKYCVGINDASKAEAFSIVCEEVSTLEIENADELKSVQACMRTAACPVEALILKDNQLMLVSNAEIMQQFLMSGSREA